MKRFAPPIRAASEKARFPDKPNETAAGGATDDNSPSGDDRQSLPPDLIFGDAGENGAGGASVPDAAAQSDFAPEPGLPATPDRDKQGV